MTILTAGETVLCPYCKKPQDDKVEDYVIPGKVGSESSCEDECPWCDAKFYVECIELGRFEVAAL